MNRIYDKLRLDGQLCFPLYAASRQIIKQYKPHLDRIDLTYTQYITMMLLWERGSLTSRELGERLFLDSGTLTPVLKKLEKKGLLIRERSEKDERNLEVTLTDEGERLADVASDIPDRMAECMHLSSDDATMLYGILYKILEAER